jgi:hypothetical protein
MIKVSKKLISVSKTISQEIMIHFEEFEALGCLGDELDDVGCIHFGDAGCSSSFSCFKWVEPSTYCPGCSTPPMETVLVLQAVQLHKTGGIVGRRERVYL